MKHFIKIFMLVLLGGLIYSCSTTKKKSRPSAEKTLKEMESENREMKSNRADALQTSVDLTDYLKRVSGIRVTGDGPSAKVVVRGVTTIRGANEPLFVVNDKQITGGYSVVYSLINIQDIEKVKVLKDASETGFYGSRGANGVIEIKLKE